MKGRGPAILSGASKAERKAALEQAMHVLINGGSASASEIVAGALSGKEF
jgi:C-terminal processing protease CtpA/Prc